MNLTQEEIEAALTAEYFGAEYFAIKKDRQLLLSPEAKIAAVRGAEFKARGAADGRSNDIVCQAMVDLASALDFIEHPDDDIRGLPHVPGYIKALKEKGTRILEDIRRLGESQ